MLLVLELTPYIFATPSQRCWTSLLRNCRMRITLLHLNHWATCLRHSLINRWIRTRSEGPLESWSLSLANPLPHGGLEAGLLMGPGPVSTNQNAAATLGPAAAVPAVEPGTATPSNFSTPAVTLPTNQTAAAQGSVTDRGVYKAPGTVKKTRYGWIIKPADCFSMMASRCNVPSPLSTLDVLDPSILPTTFSTVLFTAEDCVDKVLKRPNDF